MNYIVEREQYSIYSAETCVGGDAVKNSYAYTPYCVGSGVGIPEWNVEAKLCLLLLGSGGGSGGGRGVPAGGSLLNV